MKIKTVYDLKYAYLEKHPDGHFFDRRTMKFFGDTMKNFGIVNQKNNIILYRKNPVNGGRMGGFSFDRDTMNYKTI